LTKKTLNTANIKVQNCLTCDLSQLMKKWLGLPREW